MVPLCVGNLLLTVTNYSNSLLPAVTLTVRIYFSNWITLSPIMRMGVTSIVTFYWWSPFGYIIVPQIVPPLGALFLCPIVL